MSPYFSLIIIAIICGVVAIVSLNHMEVRNAQPAIVAVEASTTAAGSP